jgi:endonuclease/exonuclease/phosphatase family metal-dependent hydrolase
VTFGFPGRAQLALLAKTARESGDFAVIAGDFNAEAGKVQRALGEGCALSSLAGQRHTRTATGDKASHTIDHVAVWGGAPAAASVLDGGGLSDHHPVHAVIKQGEQ